MVMTSDIKETIAVKGEETGVYRIQRTCVHDGPGIRTTVFFKGCGLRCLWCQNPEALLGGTLHGEGNFGSFDEILELVLRDREYYDKSGGGVTLSGGDPLLRNPKILIPFLKRLREEGIHIAMETALYGPTDHLVALLPHVDLFLADLKVMGDDALHRRLTGQGQELILENIDRLLSMEGRVRFRMVVAPGLNDSEKNIAAAAEFLKGHGHMALELLTYHSMYVEKAKRLGLEGNPLPITGQEAEDDVRRVVALFKERGVTARPHFFEAPRKKAKFPIKPTIFMLSPALPTSCSAANIHSTG